MSVNKTRRSRTDDRDESGKCFNAFFSAENHISNSATIIFHFLPSPPLCAYLLFDEISSILSAFISFQKGFSQQKECLRIMKSCFFMLVLIVSNVKPREERCSRSSKRKNLYIHVICVYKSVVIQHSTQHQKQHQRGLFFLFPQKDMRNAESNH